MTALLRLATTCAAPPQRLFRALPSLRIAPLLATRPHQVRFARCAERARRASRPRVSPAPTRSSRRGRFESYAFLADAAQPPRDRSRSPRDAMSESIIPKTKAAEELQFVKRQLSALQSQRVKLEDTYAPPESKRARRAPIASVRRSCLTPAHARRSRSRRRRTSSRTRTSPAPARRGRSRSPS